MPALYLWPEFIPVGTLQRPLCAGTGRRHLHPPIHQRHFPWWRSVAFLWGFFSYFQKFFHWRFPGSGRQYALAGCLGSVLAVLHHWQLGRPHAAAPSAPRSTAETKEAKNEILLELSLPSSNFDSPEIAIEATGFVRKVSLISGTERPPLTLANRSSRKHLIAPGTRPPGQMVL